MLDERSDTGGSVHEPDGVSPERGERVVIPLARPWTTPGPVRPTENPLLLNRMTAGRAAVHLLTLVGVCATFMLFYTLAHQAWTGASTPQNSEDIDVEATFRATLLGGLTLSIATLVMMRSAGQPVRALGLASRSLGVDLLLGVPVAVLSFGAFPLTYLLFAQIWPAGAQQLLQNTDRVKAMVPDIHAGSLLLVMLGVAVYEELVFRGFLVTHLRRITGNWTVAVVLAGGIFAALHVGSRSGSQTMATAFPLLLVATLWAVVFIWRRSLVPAIVGHAIFNSAQMLALKYMSTSGQE